MSNLLQLSRDNSVLLANVAQDEMLRILRRYKLSLTHHRFIAKIYDDGRVTLTELTRAAYVDKGYTTRVVGRLVELGIVEKSPNPDDGRGVIVTLTPYGVELAEKLYAFHRRFVDIQNKDIDPEKLRVFRQVAEQKMRNVERHFRPQSVPSQE